MQPTSSHKGFGYFTQEKTAAVCHCRQIPSYVHRVCSNVPTGGLLVRLNYWIEYFFLERNTKYLGFSYRFIPTKSSLPLPPPPPPSCQMIFIRRDNCYQILNNWHAIKKLLFCWCCVNSFIMPFFGFVVALVNWFSLFADNPISQFEMSGY